MTLVLKSNSKFTGKALGDINGILGATDWQTMLNFADNRYTKDGSEIGFADAVTFERTNSASYVNSLGNEVTVGANVPRINKSGLIIESPSENLLLNSDAPASQTVKLTKNIFYSYRIIGNGSINVTHPAATTATGAISSNKLGFIFTTTDTANAQVTITGSNTYAEVSRIYSAPTFDTLIHTTGSVVGRNNDLATINPAIYSGLTDFTIVMHVTLNEYNRIAGIGLTQPFLSVTFSNGANLSLTNIIAASAAANTPPTQRTRVYYNGSDQSYIETSDIRKSITLAVSVSANRVSVAKNGVLSGSQPFIASAISEITLGRALAWTGKYAMLDGALSHFAVYKRAMTDTELAAISNSWV